MKSKISKSLVAFLCACAFCTSVFAKTTDKKVSIEKLSVKNYNNTSESIDANAGWYVAFGVDWVLVVR